MRRADVAHILRASRSLTNETEFVLVGSQSAHVSIADLPEVMRQSGELDIYPLRRPELAEVIDGAIGEGSPFHTTFGYYAQGVAPETAKLPRGWPGPVSYTHLRAHDPADPASRDRPGSGGGPRPRLCLGRSPDQRAAVVRT